MSNAEYYVIFLIVFFLIGGGILAMISLETGSMATGFLGIFIIALDAIFSMWFANTFEIKERK